jgi:hypothetical protein
VLRRWIEAEWSELTPLEQVAVLARLKRIGCEQAAQRLDEARDKGETSPCVGWLSYPETFGDDPRSPWDAMNALTRMLDPRVTTFCVALERKRRELAEVEPLSTDQQELETLSQQPGPEFAENYWLFTIAVMAWNKASGWSVRCETLPKVGLRFRADVDENALGDTGSGDVSRLLSEGWERLTTEQRDEVLAQMEKTGRELASERVERGFRAPARLTNFLAVFDDLLASRKAPDKLGMLTVDPRTTAFCLALEEEKRRLLGEQPLPRSIRILERLLRSAMAELAGVTEAFMREYRLLGGVAYSDDVWLVASSAVRVLAEARTPDEGFSQAEARFCGDADRLGVIAFLKEHPTLMKASSEVSAALDRHTMLVWALNKATRWRLWSDAAERMQRELLRDQIRAMLPGADVGNAIPLAAGHLLVPVAGGDDVEEKVRELLGEPMTMEEATENIGDRRTLQ